MTSGTIMRLDSGRHTPTEPAGALRLEYGERRRQRVEFRCACGYGIVVSDEPPSCPMCQAHTWQAIPARQEAA